MGQKDAEQPVYMCSLINFMAILFLDSILILAALSAIHIRIALYIVRVAVQSKNPSDGTHV